MAIDFGANGTTYSTGFVGEDDGQPSTGFGIDNVSTNAITVANGPNGANGAAAPPAKVGDTVIVTGLLPGSGDTGNTATTNTLYVTQFDNSGMLLLANYNPNGPVPANPFRYVLSNTALAARQRVTFTSDPALVNGTSGDVYMVCFVRGTLIRTAIGDVAVEDLAIGDLVVTASGAHRPIRWIGQRSYAGRFANRTPGILPVCFKAESLGDNLPKRDLWVSPKHAMFIDGKLVPAENLVNGTSVTKATHVEQVDYYHVELESHDVLLAEGAPSESFVDDNGRQIFRNAHEHAALYPDTERKDAVYCAPRLDSGHELEAIRRRIDARAGKVEKAA